MEDSIANIKDNGLLLYKYEGIIRFPSPSEMERRYFERHKNEIYLRKPSQMDLNPTLRYIERPVEFGLKLKQKFPDALYKHHIRMALNRSLDARLDSKVILNQIEIALSLRDLIELRHNYELLPGSIQIKNGEIRIGIKDLLILASLYTGVVEYGSVRQSIDYLQEDLPRLSKVFSDIFDGESDIKQQERDRERTTSTILKAVKHDRDLIRLSRHLNFEIYLDGPK